MSSIASQSSLETVSDKHQEKDNARPVALFTGSFDPFTIGHADIVRRALPLFGRLIIAVGVNERKQCMLTAAQRVEAIARLYEEEPRVSVTSYSDLTVDLAQRIGARYIVKGIRSVKDFEYEREQADINLRLSGVETLLLFASPELASVSSSVVRELVHFGRDVSEFLPAGYSLRQGED